MRKLNKWIRLAPVGAFVFAVGACSEQAPTEVQLEPGAASEAISVAIMNIFPAQQELDPGQVKQLVALPRDSRGNTVAVSGAGIVWTTSNASVATVSSTGRVRAVAGGKAYIRATYGGKTAVSAISVKAPARAASISVSASASALKVGSYAQLTAVAKDAGGDPVSTPLTWKSSNTAAVRVYSNGLIKGVGNGSATVTVSGGGATGRIAITVGATTSSTSTESGTSSSTGVAKVLVFPGSQTLSLGNAKQFIALPRNSAGKTVAAGAPVWKSSNTSVATVSATGLVISRGVGTAVITATVDGVTGRSSLSVVR